MLFLDQYSLFLWVYLLKAKYDVYSKFVNFQSFVQNQLNCEIKSFQYDNGGEYNKTQFHMLYESHGI